MTTEVPLRGCNAVQGAEAARDRPDVVHGADQLAGDEVAEVVESSSVETDVMAAPSEDVGGEVRAEGDCRYNPASAF
jgi:hypothetical protein